MKGITLLSDIFLIFALLALTVITTLFIWYLIIIYEVESALNVATPRNVELKLFFKPVKYDNIMLSFLEYEYESIPMKKIVSAVAIQNSTDIWIEGKFIDAKAVSENLLSKVIDKEYLLKISPQEIQLAKSGDLVSTGPPLEIQKISTELFLLDGEAIDLQLFVRD